MLNLGTSFWLHGKLDDETSLKAFGSTFSFQFHLLIGEINDNFLTVNITAISDSLLSFLFLAEPNYYI